MSFLPVPSKKLHSLESGALFVLKRGSIKVYEYVQRHFSLIQCVDAVTQEAEFLDDNLNVYPLKS